MTLRMTAFLIIYQLSYIGRIMAMAYAGF